MIFAALRLLPSFPFPKKQTQTEVKNRMNPKVRRQHGKYIIPCLNACLVPFQKRQFGFETAEKLFRCGIIIRHRVAVIRIGGNFVRFPVNLTDIKPFHHPVDQPSEAGERGLCYVVKPLQPHGRVLLVKPDQFLTLKHISEPTRHTSTSRKPSSA